jgi:hypothetical protein
LPTRGPNTTFGDHFAVTPTADKQALAQEPDNMRPTLLKAFVISNVAWLAVGIAIASPLTLLGVETGYAEGYVSLSSAAPHLPLTAAEERALKPKDSFKECDACVADGGCNGYRPLDRNWGRGAGQSATHRTCSAGTSRLS